MQIDVLLVDLIVVLPVGADGQVRVENDPSVFRTKESGVGVSHGRENSKAMDIDRADAGGYSVQLGLLPADRKRNRRTEQSVEVESVARVLAEVTHIHHDPPAEPLLNAGVILIPAAEGDGSHFSGAREQIANQTARSGGAGRHQVLRRRRLHGVAVAAANDGPGRLEQIRKRPARLDSVSVGEAVVAIGSQSDVQGKIAQADGVLREQCDLGDVGPAAELVGRSTTGQVIRQQPARRVIRRIGDSQAEGLVEPGLRRVQPGFPVMPPLHAREIGMQSEVSE